MGSPHLAQNSSVRNTKTIAFCQFPGFYPIYFPLSAAFRMITASELGRIPTSPPFVGEKEQACDFPMKNQSPVEPEVLLTHVPVYHRPVRRARSIFALRQEMCYYLFIGGFVSHLEQMWEEPGLARFLHRLASFSHLNLLHKRGVGLSDQVGYPLTLEHTVTHSPRLSGKYPGRGFYGAWLLMGISLGSILLRNVAQGYPMRRALPAGYGLSMVGVLLWLPGGVGDMLWHTAFGFEENIDSLYSLTHLILAVGFFLMVMIF